MTFWEGGLARDSATRTRSALVEHASTRKPGVWEDTPADNNSKRERRAKHSSRFGNGLL